MRLETAEFGGDAFRLVLSPLELTEIRALATFAKAGIAYDANAAYVAQVFVYIFLQPSDLVKDPDTQAAFAALEHLGEPDGDFVLRLPKAQMRQILMMLSMAAGSEEQADIIHDSDPDRFPERFPNMEFPGDYYEGIIDELLTALHEDRALKIDRLPSG